MAIAFWAVTGLLIPITLVIVLILAWPRANFVVAGALVLYAALVATIYQFEDGDESTGDDQ